MNRKWVVLALVGLLALLPTLPPSPAAAGHTGGTIYLALGDSLAAGYGHNVIEKHPYVSRFYDFLQAGHHSDVDTLVNLGIGGETSASLITGGQLNQAVAVILDPATDVSVVTLDIGANDMLDLTKEGGPCADPSSPQCLPAAIATLQQFSINYGTILGTLAQALASDPGEERVIVLTYFNAWDGQGLPYEPVVESLLFGADQTVDCANFAGPNVGVNDVITCLPGAIGLGSLVTVADIYPTFVGKTMELTYMAYNDIHPNNAGHTQIANVVRKAYLSR
jgi:lysophospholipase L1-like esterase